MPIQSSGLTLNIAAFSARLLEEHEVFPRARITAQTIAEALPGSAVNVYAIADLAEGDVWTVIATAGQAAVPEATIPLQAGTLGILVHGNNHFIVRGPLPARSVAQALARHWSLIQIDRKTPPELDQWRISSKEYRENLAWAVFVPGEGEISPAVSQLLEELSRRGIIIHNSRLDCW